MTEYGYECPDCGGRMHTYAMLTDPPICEARCYDCGVLYRRRPIRKPQLPREYERIGKDTDHDHR